MSFIPTILMSISVVLLASGVLLWIWEQYEKWVSSKASQYTINCSKVKLARTILSWGLTNIQPTSKKQSVNFKVYYHPHKKRMGAFRWSTREIVLYVNNHQNVLELIDTALHEIVHYKQYVVDPRSFEKEYQKLLSNKGYDDHPMEIEARKGAAANVSACLEYLLTHQFVIKK